MGDDDDFGDFAEPTTAAADTTTLDDFGDFDTAGTSTSAPFLPPVSPPRPDPAPLPTTSSDPDILLLPDDEFAAFAATAWPTRGCHAPSAESLSASLQRLRAMRMAPSGVDPFSILGLGGIPMAAASSSASAEPANGSGGPALLGHVYTPVVRCDAIQEWRGSASEQRLLTSLGLWETAQQAREWEEAEAAAGARYDRRGCLFGVGSSTPGSQTGLSRSGSSTPAAKPSASRGSFSASASVSASGRFDHVLRPTNSSVLSPLGSGG